MHGVTIDLLNRSVKWNRGVTRIAIMSARSSKAERTSWMHRVFDWKEKITTKEIFNMNGPLDNLINDHDKWEITDYIDLCSQGWSAKVSTWRKTRKGAKPLHIMSPLCRFGGTVYHGWAQKYIFPVCDHFEKLYDGA